MCIINVSDVRGIDNDDDIDVISVSSVTGVRNNTGVNWSVE